MYWLSLPYHKKKLFQQIQAPLNFSDTHWSLPWKIPYADANHLIYACLKQEPLKWYCTLPFPEAPVLQSAALPHIKKHFCLKYICIYFLLCSVYHQIALTNRAFLQEPHMPQCSVPWKTLQNIPARFQIQALWFLTNQKAHRQLHLFW